MSPRTADIDHLREQQDDARTKIYRAGYRWPGHDLTHEALAEILAAAGPGWDATRSACARHGLVPNPFPDPRTAYGYRALREDARLTQQELADLEGVDRMTIGARETGRQPIRLESALALLYLVEHEGRTPWDTHTNGDAP